MWTEKAQVKTGGGGGVGIGPYHKCRHVFLRERERRSSSFLMILLDFRVTVIFKKTSVIMLDSQYAAMLRGKHPRKFISRRSSNHSL